MQRWKFLVFSIHCIPVAQSWMAGIVKKYWFQAPGVQTTVGFGLFCYQT